MVLSLGFMLSHVTNIKQVFCRGQIFNSVEVTGNTRPSL